MIPLLFAFLALPCLSQGSSKGLNQLIKEEDKFHLLTEVCLDQIYQREEYKFYSGTFCLNQTNFYFPYKAYQLFSQQNIPGILYHEKSTLFKFLPKNSASWIVMCLCIWVILGHLYFDHYLYDNSEIQSKVLCSSWLRLHARPAPTTLKTFFTTANRVSSILKTDVWCLSLVYSKIETCLILLSASQTMRGLV